MSKTSQDSWVLLFAVEQTDRHLKMLSCLRQSLDSYKKKESIAISIVHRKPALEKSFQTLGSFESLADTIDSMKVIVIWNRRINPERKAFPALTPCGLWVFNKTY